MKRIPLVLIPVVMLISGESNQAVAGETGAKGGFSLYITSGDKIRIERPDLVTPVKGKKVDFTVDSSAEKQAIVGFGGSFNEQGWAALSVLDEGERQKILTTIFAPGEANLSFGRIPIGASDYALERYTLAPVADDFEMKNFSLERDERYLIPFISAARKIRPDIKLWASAWSPPIWMKDNNEYEGGSFIDDPQYYRAYALYLAKFAEAYAKRGFAIDSIAVQNEPTVKTGYPNGGWKPGQFRVFIRDYFGPLFAERGLKTKIMLGTLNDGNYDTFAKTVLDDPEAKKYVGVIGLQWDGDRQIASILKHHPGIPIMQTETDCGNWHWKPGFIADRPPNDFKYAAYTWTRMKDYFSEGAESYMLWNIVLDQEGKNIDKLRRWPQNSPIVIDTTTKKVTYTPMFRAFEHYSRFIPVGSKYVSTRGSYGGAIAFSSPDGTVIVELLNATGKKRVVTGDIDGSPYSVELPPESFATLIVKK